MSYEAARLAVEVIHEILVLHLQHRFGRQNGAPMLHENVVSAIVASEFGEVIGEGLPFREQKRVAGYAGVDRIPLYVDDPCPGKCQMDETNEQEVSGHLVDEAILRCDG